MANKKVEMLRPVGGFEEGDTRTLSKADAERLEARGVVKILGDAKDDEPDGEKAERALPNKAEGAAPANKAAVSGTVKKGSK